MPTLLAALKIAGFVLLGILTLLLLLLHLPVRLLADWREGILKVDVRLFGLLKLGVFPKKPKAEESSAERTEERTESKRAEKKFSLDLLRDMLSPTGRALKMGLAGIKMRKLSITLVAGGRDAAEVGRNCGLLWASLGSVLGLLQNNMSVECRLVEVLPDFEGQLAGGSKVSFELKCLPVSLLLAGSVLAVGYIKNKRRG